MQLDLVNHIQASQRIESVQHLPRSTPKQTIQQKFEEFHAENPQVYARLVQLARGLQVRGHQKIGIGMLWEVVRWDSMLTTTGDPWKLNNNFRSRYARLIEGNEPGLAGLFDKRTLISA